MVNGLYEYLLPKNNIRVQILLENSFSEVQQIQTSVGVTKLTNNPKHTWMNNNISVLHCFSI